MIISSINRYSNLSPCKKSFHLDEYKVLNKGHKHLDDFFLVFYEKKMDSSGYSSANTGPIMIKFFEHTFQILLEGMVPQKVRKNHSICPNNGSKKVSRGKGKCLPLISSQSQILMNFQNFWAQNS